MVRAVPLAPIAGLHERVIDYAGSVHEQQTPSDVLNALHDITTKGLALPVLGAARFPPKAAGWDGAQLGDSIFLHKAVPKGWWEEYEALARGKFRPLLFLAQSSMAPFTWAEAKQVLEPVGIDRWSDALFFKYGIRDALCCPVGGQWVIVFWSRKILSKVLESKTRSIIFAAATFAALRLEQVTHPGRARLGSSVRLTPREIAVLRLISTGAQNREVAEALRLGAETVRSHLKKAQAKLGVRNRAHAVAEALRQNLIP
jgi:DNA-binding CsgD family transcriptional regulator